MVATFVAATALLLPSCLHVISSAFSTIDKVKEGKRTTLEKSFNWANVATPGDNTGG
jgi:hypothetical protein